MGDFQYLNKPQLDKFLNLIEDVATRTGNEWFAMELIQRIRKRYTAKVTTQFTENGQINEIYEYCIANILEKQSESMYKCIEDVNLRETLIFDFIRMEKFRREDRFEEFCLAAFQQIEAMVNFVLNKHEEYRVRGKSELEELAFTRKTLNGYESNKSGNKTLGYYLFDNKFKPVEKKDILNLFNRNYSNWEAFQRVKFMVYYHYFDGVMSYPEVEEHFSLFVKLKNMRDANHRNTEVTDGNKPRDIEITRSNRMEYYIKFSGLVYQFKVWYLGRV